MPAASVSHVGLRFALLLTILVFGALAALSGFASSSSADDTGAPAADVVPDQLVVGFDEDSSDSQQRKALSKAGVTGFVTVSGDRHSFWAGLAASALPPQAFEPIGAAFVTGSVSAPGIVEAMEHRFPKDHPLRALYLADLPRQSRPQAAINMLLHHGVRSCLEYQRTGDLERARALSNRELSPHLSFVDMGGHGYATVRVDASTMVTEFVCIPRPIARSTTADGGPLRYRVRHEVPLWRAGERPQMRQTVVEGDPGLSV